MKNYLFVFVGAVLACALGFYIALMSHQEPQKTGGITNGSQADACASTTNAVIAVGKDIPTTLQATTSNRGVLVIQQPRNATNTIAISTTIAAANFLTAGLQIGSTTAAASTAINPIPTIVMLGLNTVIPYTGAVSAISETGSTTVLVSTCNY